MRAIFRLDGRLPSARCRPRAAACAYADRREPSAASTGSVGGRAVRRPANDSHRGHAGAARDRVSRTGGRLPGASVSPRDRCWPRRCCGKACPSASSTCWRSEVRPFTDKQIELAKDLRRPGGHRHRERAPVPGAAGADGRADALGGAAHGARRCRPGAQLDPRSGHGAPDHRDARQPAGRDRRLLRLRVRRGDRRLPPPRHPQP